MTDELEHLMHQAGRRAAPPDGVRDQVYAATHDAWRRQVRRRVQRRQLAVAASLFAVALVGALAWVSRQPAAGSLEVASVLSLSGEIHLREDSGAAAAGPLLASRVVRKGEQIDTEPGSRLTLRRPGGILIHVGGDSQLIWQTDDALRVMHGVVYVDTNVDSKQAEHDADALEILTPTGRIRHVGTRFSVQVDSLDVRVLVREGAVAVGGSRGEQRVESGHGARIASDGQLSEVALTAGEGPWQWLGSEQPEFVIEGRRLDDVLRDLALASGLPLRYGSPQIEASASELVLHGPALALDAREAIDTVLLTTQFARHAPLEIVARP